MNIAELKDLVNKGLSSHKIAKIMGCSQCNIRYWLKKLGLKTNYTPTWVVRQQQNTQNNKCVLCGKPNKSQDGRCRSCDVDVRRSRLKMVALAILGMSCSECGNKVTPFNLPAFHFHHTDPSQKEFAISYGTYSFETMKKEIQKCRVLCGYCHSIKHATKYTAKFLEICQDYNGTNTEFENLLKKFFDDSRPIA